MFSHFQQHLFFSKRERGERKDRGSDRQSYKYPPAPRLKITVDDQGESWTTKHSKLLKKYNLCQTQICCIFYVNKWLDNMGKQCYGRTTVGRTTPARQSIAYHWRHSRAENRERRRNIKRFKNAFVPTNKNVKITAKSSMDTEAHTFLANNIIFHG